MVLVFVCCVCVLLVVTNGSKSTWGLAKHNQCVKKVYQAPMFSPRIKVYLNWLN